MKHEPSNNDYGHTETSDGKVISGSYRVLLPDTRIQIVEYRADDDNGYIATVRYEGEAKYDPYRPAYKANYVEANKKADYVEPTYAPETTDYPEKGNIELEYQTTPAYKEPEYLVPAYKEPEYPKPEYPTPAYKQPEYPAPVYKEPEYPTPAYKETEYPKAEYPAPTYKEPEYPEPAYKEPEYPKPEYPAPTYKEPEYQAPAYKEPEYPAPAYKEPEYPKPEYPAPTDRKSVV